MDWINEDLSRIYVDNDEFAGALRRVETDIAFKEVSSRGWATYTDLDLLTTTATVRRVWSLLADCCVKVSAVCLTAYAASLLTLLGTSRFILNESTPGKGPQPPTLGLYCSL